MTAAANPHRDAALAGWDAGLSMLLIRQDGTKSPAGKWKRRQQRRCTRRALERLYTRSRRTGVGFVTGKISGGVRLFEAERRADFETLITAANYLGLGDLLDRIRRGYEEETPGGGVHLLLRVDVDSGNTVLAATPAPTTKNPHGQKPLFETREEGGVAITAPSSGRVHPTGKGYRLVSGGFATIATITPDEWRALCNLARSFDQMPVKEYRPPAARGISQTGGRPGDEFAARTDWPAILEPAGYTFIRTRGDAVSEWTRPEKTRGLSVTTNHAGSDLLYVFSSSTPFEPNRGYGKFSAYAILNHSGDFKAAAQELARQGYGTSPSPATVAPLEPLNLPPAPALETETAGCPELAEENARLRAELTEERRLRIEERQHRIAVETELAAYKAALGNKQFAPAERVIAIKCIEDLAESQRRGRVDGDGFAPAANTVIAEKVGIKPGNIAKHLTVIAASCDRIERDKVQRARTASIRAKLHGSKVEVLQAFAQARRVEPTGKRAAWGGKRPALCPDHPTARIITKVQTTYHCGRCDRQLDPDVSLPVTPTTEDTQVGYAPVSIEVPLILHTQVGYPARVKEPTDGRQTCAHCGRVGRREICESCERTLGQTDELSPAPLVLQLAARLGFQEVDVGEGIVPPGAAAWRAWQASASPQAVERATGRLRGMVEARRAVS